jgi:hypothetical protein
MPILTDEENDKMATDFQNDLGVDYKVTMKQMPYLGVELLHKLNHEERTIEIIMYSPRSPDCFFRWRDNLLKTIRESIEKHDSKKYKNHFEEVVGRITVMTEMPDMTDCDERGFSKDKLVEAEEVSRLNHRYYYKVSWVLNALLLFKFKQPNFECNKCAECEHWSIQFKICNAKGCFHYLCPKPNAIMLFEDLDEKTQWSVNAMVWLYCECNEKKTPTPKMKQCLSDLVKREVLIIDKEIDKMGTK